MMSMQVTLTLPDAIYAEASHVAKRRKRDVVEVLTDALQREFAPLPVHPRRREMLREIEAFKQLHPTLVTRYLGQFVAVFSGQVIDHDADIVALKYRVSKKHLHEIVLIRQVEEQASRDITLRNRLGDDL